jgi:hypothetical protein
MLESLSQESVEGLKLLDGTAPKGNTRSPGSDLALGIDKKFVEEKAFDPMGVIFFPFHDPKVGVLDRHGNLGIKEG